MVKVIHPVEPTAPEPSSAGPAAPEEGDAKQSIDELARRFKVQDPDGSLNAVWLNMFSVPLDRATTTIDQGGAAAESARLRSQPLPAS